MASSGDGWASGCNTYRGAEKSLARPGRKQATATEDFDFHTSYLFIIIIGGILVLYIQGVPGGMYKTSGECSLC